MKRIATLLQVAALTAVVSCGDGNGTGPEEGSFQATVSGDLNLSLSGSAVFGIQTEQGQQGFVIGLMRGNPGSNDSDIIVITKDNTETPAAGTYSIVSGTCTTCTADDFAGALLHQVTSADFGMFLSESGSFTLGSVSTDRLEGSFNFTASAFLKAGSVTAEDLTLRGTFIAIPGEIPSIGQ